jgi:predicted nucleotidyltransferase
LYPTEEPAPAGQNGGIIRQVDAPFVAMDRAEVERFCAAYPEVRLIVLFGSLIRGQARPDSDLDIGVLGGGLWDQLAVGTEVGRTAGREPHVVDLAKASEWLCFQVARDGVLVFERAPTTWAQFKAQAMIRYWDIAPLIALGAEGVRRRLAREAQADHHG